MRYSQEHEGESRERLGERLRRTLGRHLAHVRSAHSHVEGPLDGSTTLLRTK